MSLLSGYWLLFFHNTKMKLSSSSITQQWMLWCLPFVLNQSIDTLYKRVPFYQTKNVTVLLDQTIKETRVQKLAIAQPVAWPYSSIQLKVNVITSPETHLKKKAISELCKCEQWVPLLNHVGSVRWKKKAILWYPLKLDWISKQNQFARAILLPLV